MKTSLRQFRPSLDQRVIRVVRCRQASLRRADSLSGLRAAGVCPRLPHKQSASLVRLQGSATIPSFTAKPTEATCSPQPIHRPGFRARVDRRTTTVTTRAPRFSQPNRIPQRQGDVSSVLMCVTPSDSFRGCKSRSQASNGTNLGLIRTPSPLTFSIPAHARPFGSLDVRVPRTP